MASSSEFQPATGSSAVVQFGPFELDRSAGELRKQGTRVSFTLLGERLLHFQLNPNTITLNYTTILNLIFLVLAALLLSGFFRTGGRQMLRHMK
jgi:hypothetical protein